VLLTSVGNAGGTTSNPTYRNIGDHTESFQVVFDPKVVSYDSLLDVFWSEHNPHSKGWSTQYQNIAFYETDAQRDAIQRHVKRIEQGGRKVKTRMQMLGIYTLAEDYHQKHSLRSFPDFVEELKGRAPGDAWMFSREATKLNGYLGGYGTCDSLEKKVRGFRLPEDKEKYVLDVVCLKEGREGQACPVPARK
jgi:peptide-methionine (S)-S-oxide reductase